MTFIVLNVTIIALEGVIHIDSVNIEMDTAIMAQNMSGVL